MGSRVGLLVLSVRPKTRPHEIRLADTENVHHISHVVKKTMIYWACDDCGMLEETTEDVPALFHRHYLMAFGKNGYRRSNNYYYEPLQKITTLWAAKAFRESYERKKTKKS